MKQYKFKCPICGKWKDIRQQGEYFKADCICNLDFFEKFHIVRLGLAKLLSTLRKHNIEIAEVCDKLKFRYNTGGWFESQKVIRRGKLGSYFITLDLAQSNVVCGFECSFCPAKEDDNNVVDLDYFTIERDAKAACQADFKNRRAK